MAATESDDQVRTAVNIVTPAPNPLTACFTDIRGGGTVEVRLKSPLAGRSVVGPYRD